jgi:hypothetical protein
MRGGSRFSADAVCTVVTVRALELIYVMERLPASGRVSIYLAGPVPRDPAEPSWHLEAVAALGERRFDGCVVIPRPRDGKWPDSLDAQIRWEVDAQRRANVLLFWIDRDLKTRPGLTTNLEWGLWHDSGRAVLGAPADAPKMAYLRHWARLAGAPMADTLEASVDAALTLLGRAQV